MATEPETLANETYSTGAEHLHDAAANLYADWAGLPHWAADDDSSNDFGDKEEES